MWCVDSFYNLYMFLLADEKSKYKKKIPEYTRFQAYILVCWRLHIIIIIITVVVVLTEQMKM